MASTFNDFTLSGVAAPNDYIVGYDLVALNGERRWTVATIANAVSGVMTPQLNSAFFNSTDIIPIAKGGTERTTGFAGLTSLAGTVAPVANTYLKVNTTNNGLTYDAIDLNSTDVTGILPVSKGGTARTTGFAGLTALAGTVAPIASTYLKVNTTNNGLLYDTINLASSDVTGILPVANGGTGSSTGAGLPYSIDALIVGGGGAGGGSNGGGGGAGGCVQVTTNVFAGNTYGVLVGAGADGGNTVNGSPYLKGRDGLPSSFAGFIALGGGGGAGEYNNYMSQAGDGGSGGGSNGALTTMFAYVGSGTTGQGNDGGRGTNTAPNNYTAGGGGGAGAVGSNGNGTNGGVGGVGINWKSLGTFYGGGGGGGAQFVANGGNGGSGGGGKGGAGSGGVGQNGTANTGGGGGGGINGEYGGSGGSGIVIIRYQSATQLATGGTVTSSGVYYYHTFTSSGTFTA